MCHVSNSYLCVSIYGNVPLTVEIINTIDEGLSKLIALYMVF